MRARSIGYLLAGALASIGMPAANAADEPIVLISRFHVNPGQEPVFEERTRMAVEFVRKAEPDVIYRLQRSITNPSQYVFYEVYPSQTAFDRHMKETLPAFAKAVGPRPEGMLARPPENEKLVPMER